MRRISIVCSSSLAASSHPIDASPKRRANAQATSRTGMAGARAPMPRFASAEESCAVSVKAVCRVTRGHPHVGVYGRRGSHSLSRRPRSFASTSVPVGLGGAVRLAASPRRMNSCNHCVADSLAAESSMPSSSQRRCDSLTPVSLAEAMSCRYSRRSPCPSCDPGAPP